MYCIVLIPATAYSQDWQSLLSIDTRTGYSTNTVLNPFHGVWDRTTNSGFGFVSPMVQIQKFGDRLAADITAAGVYEPFFDDKEALRGGLGLVNLRYRFSSDFSAGLEAGGSSFTSLTNRQVGWVQPMIAWSPTLYSQIRLKAGSMFQVHESSEDESIEQRRYDQYGIEFETWPRFNWQIRTGFYGNLDNPTETMSLQFLVNYLPVPKISMGMRINANQYQFTQIVNGTEGPGGPPIGGPGGGGTGTTETIDETDRILRAGVTLQYQLLRSLAVMVNADRMDLHSSRSDESLLDYQISAGIRYSFRSTFGARGKAEPDWRQNGGQTLILKVNYTGDGQLYITGDFNDWDQPGIPLSKQSTRRYAAQLSLQPGAYDYKILLIDGDEQQWIEFTDDTYTVRDGFGGVNGRVIID